MRYAILFFGQGLNFLIAVINMRAIASGRWAMTAVSDFVFCLVSYTLIQRIAHAGSSLELLAYAAGGTVGSLLAMYATRHWKGHV